MTAQSCIFRDVLVVPPLGETPFEGWVAVEDTTIAAVGRAAPKPRNNSQNESATNASSRVARSSNIGGYFFKLRTYAMTLSISLPATLLIGFILPWPSVMIFFRSASL